MKYCMQDKNFLSMKWVHLGCSFHGLVNIMVSVWDNFSHFRMIDRGKSLDAMVGVTAIMQGWSFIFLCCILTV